MKLDRHAMRNKRWVKLADPSAMLASVGNRKPAFALPHGRGEGFHHGGSPDQRDWPAPTGKPRDIYIPDLSLDTIKTKTREFR